MTKSLKTIENLKKLNLKNSRYEDVLELVSQITYPAFFFHLEAGKSVFRARPHKENEMFHFEKELSYRTDIQNINNHNRANPAYSTMFYGAIATQFVKDGYLISATETSDLCRNNKDGVDALTLRVDTLTISKWILKRSMKVLIIMNPTNYKFHSKDIDDIYRAYLDFINSQEYPEEIKLISSYLANEFSKKVKKGEEYEYMISAAFSELFFDKGFGFNGIVYPSVQTELQGYNIAIMPYVVDDNLILDKVLLAQLHKTGNDIDFPQFKLASLNYPYYQQPFQYNDLNIEYKLGLKYLLSNR